MNRRSDDVVAELVRMVIDVVGEDFLLDIEVNRETSFTDDLALESIEFVALTERVRNHYGSGLDFPAFFASKTIHEITAMSVGDMADFIESSLDARALNA